MAYGAVPYGFVDVNRLVEVPIRPVCGLEGVVPCLEEAHILLLCPFIKHISVSQLIMWDLLLALSSMAMGVSECVERQSM